MYITAQRVRSSSGGAREGVNAFLNLHRETETVSEDWDNPSLERLADTNPGVLVDQLCDVPPGGNRVRSYLDVVAPNTADAEAIRGALEAFEAVLAMNPSLPCIATIMHIAVRYDAERALEAEAPDEYRTLRARVNLLLERWLGRDTRKVASSGG
jgi:hypothetical protein